MNDDIMWLLLNIGLFVLTVSRQMKNVYLNAIGLIFVTHGIIIYISLGFTKF